LKSVKKNNLFAALCMLLISFSTVSCAGKIKNENILFTGYVFDEANRPVSEMELHIKQNGHLLQKTVTNQSGVFSLKSVSRGKIRVSGEKEGYSKLDEEIEIRDFSKVFCIQLRSADSVLDEADRLIKSGNYREALNRISEISSCEGSVLNECISFYKNKIKEGEGLWSDSEK